MIGRLRGFKLRFLIPVILGGYALVLLSDTFLVELPALEAEVESAARQELVQVLTHQQGTFDRLFRKKDSSAMRQEVSFMGGRQAYRLVLILDDAQQVMASSRYALKRTFTRDSLDEEAWALIARAAAQGRGVTGTDATARTITAVFPLVLGPDAELGRNRTGYLVVEYDYSLRYEETARLIYAHMWMVLSFLGIVSLLLWFFFSRVLTRPIESLVKASHRLATGDFGARARPAGSGELVQLGKAFNSMAASLERYHAELSTREKQYRELMENVGTGVVVHAPDTSILEANKVASHTLGLTRDQMLGKEAIDPSWYFLDEREERLPLEKYPVMRVLADQKPFVNQVLGISDPNREKTAWVLVNGVPEFDEKGNLARVIISFTDISERKRAQKQLEENRRYLRLILDSQPNIVVINSGNRLIDANRAFFDFFEQYEDVDAFRKEHRCICELFEATDRSGYLLPDLDPSVWIKRLVEKPDVLHKAQISKGGTPHVFGIHIKEIDLGGDIQNIVTFVDISELEHYQIGLENKVEKEVALRREQEVQLLQQARVAQMGELITNISHHWRQPLNLIGLEIQDILDAYDHGELDREYLEKNVDDSLKTLEKMSATISNFRELVATGGKKSRFDVGVLLGKITELMSAMLKSHFIQVETRLPEGIEATGDPTLLEQTIHHILINAQEAMIERKRDVRRVDIRLDRTDHGSRIVVEDTAGGIPEKVMARLFDPFFTTKELATKTGNGLYFAKRFVEVEFGGQLEAENTAEGARFIITLPLPEPDGKKAKE